MSSPQQQPSPPSTIASAQQEPSPPTTPPNQPPPQALTSTARGRPRHCTPRTPRNPQLTAPLSTTRNTRSKCKIVELDATALDVIERNRRNQSPTKGRGRRTVAEAEIQRARHHTMTQEFMRAVREREERILEARRVEEVLTEETMTEDSMTDDEANAAPFEDSIE